jgi:para-aminobenzoate synthetase / 4-amino-4-deoxychorismate lyase
MRKISLYNLLTDIPKNEDFVLLQTDRLDRDNRYSYLFTKPIEVISCWRLDEVKPSLNKIEKMLDNGFFAAGFLSYEAGFAFEPIFSQVKDYDFPLLWFGIFEKPLRFDHKYIEFQENSPSKEYSIEGIDADISEKEYTDSVKNVKRYIEKGHTYQVNRTFKLKFSFKGCPQKIYLGLKNKQSVSYSSLIRFGEHCILSYSPELFFRKKENQIQVKPMKGTIERGLLAKEDTKNANILCNCQKNKSENIMIVDLLRNDVGRIAVPGTVKTTKFFEVEKYESLFQMTSTVKASLRQDVSLFDLFKAVFPSGSVTGAPKIRTMQIIDEIENSPRRIYTGAIGFITPKKDSVFNVAIRTLILNSDNCKGEMGIGSGIVYDSEPKKEYEECLLKAKFLTEKYREFKLIETMVWEPANGYALMELHMQRLLESADYFNYKYSRNDIIKHLKKISKGFNSQQKYRVRLLLDKNGNMETSCSSIDMDSALDAITISSRRTDSSDKWLYHKTTNRRIYDSEHSKYRKLGFFDIIFQNEKGQITEGAISNIFIEKAGIYYTPPIECGVLKGVYRSYLLNQKKLKVKEKIIYLKDLLKADNIIMTNAVRGIVKVRLHANNRSLIKSANHEIIKEHSYV